MENHVAQASVHAACSSMWLKGVISAIKEMKELKGHRAGEEAALQGRSGGGCPRKKERCGQVPEVRASPQPLVQFSYPSGSLSDLGLPPTSLSS